MQLIQIMVVLKDVLTPLALFFAKLGRIFQDCPKRSVCTVPHFAKCFIDVVFFYLVRNNLN